MKEVGCMNNSVFLDEERNLIDNLNRIDLLISKINQKIDFYNYEVENTEALTNIGFRINDKKYGSSTLNNVVPQTEELYNELGDIQIEIIVKLSEYHDLETLYFDEFSVQYESTFVLNEMTYRNNNLLNSVFVPEYE